MIPYYAKFKNLTVGYTSAWSYKDLSSPAKREHNLETFCLAENIGNQLVNTSTVGRKSVPVGGYTKYLKVG